MRKKEAEDEEEDVENGKFKSAASFYLSIFQVPAREFPPRYLRMFKRLIRSA